MLMNDGFHVCHGAVAYFYCVSVKYFVEFPGCWEMLVNEIQKLSANVGLDVFVVWRIEPGNIAMSLASVRGGNVGRFDVIVREVRAEIAVVEEFLVWWNCFLESWVVAGES